MYPNQPTNQSNYSIDYLNQIAPQAPKKSGLSRLQIILVAGIGTAIILIGIIGIVMTSTGGTAPSKQLAARLQGTEKIVSSAQGKLKSTQLRTLNSNLLIYLTNTNRDIAAPLLLDGITVTKLDKTLLASEAGAALTSRLEDARLNAVYDRTYAREISYQLETIVALMRNIHGSTSNKSFKTFLENAMANLEPTQKQFAEFNAANA